MTELLEEAISLLKLRPPEEQDQAAAALLEFVAQRDAAYRLTPEQEAEVEATLKALEDGTERLATDEEVAAMWRRLGV